jgi:hypothetical protein
MDTNDGVGVADSEAPVTKLRAHMAIAELIHQECERALASVGRCPNVRAPHAAILCYASRVSGG